jgi:hypothetical protein
MISVFLIGYQEVNIVSLFPLWGSSVRILFKKFENEQNINPTHTVEPHCSDQCRTNFAASVLDSGSAAICPLQWTNDYSIAWSNSPQQIRTFPGFRIGIFDLSSKMHVFLFFMVLLRIFPSPAFHMPEILPSICHPYLCGFQWRWLGLPISAGDIDEIIDVILCQNGSRQRCLRDRFDAGQEIGTLSMNGTNKGMNLVIFTAERFLMNYRQIEVLRNQWHPRKHCRSFSIQCSALELTNNRRKFPIRYQPR